MKTYESEETYLETILMLGKSGGTVRSVDVANELEYSRPSVSVAVKKLKEKGFVEIGADGFITLTAAGRDIAESMYERHMLLSDWLIFLGVDRETAVSDACRIEHALSGQSFAAIKEHIEKWKREVYQRK
jgi:Mn-dependent DtxR family transcriptional regulator